ncbi:MAG: nitrate ABC transporter permease [Alteromonadaceae bacterium]|nr:nitrate ABC transporter permease [Alteromonadaceae bacterium]|tara:strand:+ start:613 stop:1623 length:1011 start_codon:yes stop_codon:yes gene_type:complete
MTSTTTTTGANASTLSPFARITHQARKGLTAGQLMHRLGLPMIGLAVFLMLWQWAAESIETSLGAFPGPAEVWQQADGLWEEHQASRERASKFIAMQEARNERILEQNPEAEVRIRSYNGAPTFIDQIGTSLVTVMSGFLLGAVIAIPLGIFMGMSRAMQDALNPLIQLFKPVSPLAWLPLVTLVVSAVYVSDDPLFEKSFLISLFTVTLCSLWPILINTAAGVASVSEDLHNVSRVLSLPTWTHIRRIVLPSAIPHMFIGLRISLGIAWMVLIAAEMLAQNPGLGKFVWDEFQNGSSASLGRIMVAVLTIGLIGFLLDRLMVLLQQKVSWDSKSA